MVTSKQPNSRQGTNGVRTRSGLVKIKIKSGPVKILQGIGHIEFTENSRQGRADGAVW